MEPPTPLLTPLLDAYHTALYLVLHYCRPATTSQDLLNSRILLTLPERRLNTSNKIETSNTLNKIELSNTLNKIETWGLELEWVLRLALRPQVCWLRLKILIEEYGSQHTRVQPALLQLHKEKINLLTERDETFLEIIEGKEVAKLIAGVTDNNNNNKDNREIVKEVLRTAKVSELRRILQLQPQSPTRYQKKKGGDEEVVVVLVDEKKEGNNNNNKEEEEESCDDNDSTIQVSQSISSSVIGRTSSALPSRKEEIINRIISSFENEETFASAWDNVIGPLCRVHHQLKSSIKRISEMFYIITHPCGVGNNAINFTQPAQSPYLGILFLVEELLSQSGIKDSLGVALPPWWASHIYEKEILKDNLITFYLFSSPDMIENYKEAMKLYEKLEKIKIGGKSWRHWDIAFTMTSHKTIENGIIKLEEEIKKKLNISTIRKNNYSHKRMRSQNLNNEEKEIIYVEDILQYGGLLYEHLLPFLPKYAWFACAEILVPILQYNKKWDLANKWLQRLLEEPIYELKSPCGTVTFPLYYCYYKRGSWWYRLAQNFIHLGDKKTAFTILETQQKFWQQKYSTKKYISLEDDINNIPVSIQRRARLLRALFPSKMNINIKFKKDLALYNAIGEYHRLHFCRRSDRLAIEGTLTHLHRSLNRWTPIPSIYSYFTKQLIKVNEIIIQAARDPMEPTLWRDIHHTLSSCSVEEYVLRWFGAKQKYKIEDIYNNNDDNNSENENNNNNDEWFGLHCEGRWISFLARILLWDAYTFNPDNNNNNNNNESNSEKESKKEKEIPEYIWLSSFQETPLDFHSSINFTQRRRNIIEERLNFFEQCPRDSLIDYVTQRCHLGKTPLKDENNIRNVIEIKNNKESSIHGSGSETSLLSSLQEEEDDDDGIILPGQTTQREKEDNVNKSFSSTTLDHNFSDPYFFFQSMWNFVENENFPIISILQAIPQRPLCNLLRYLFLSPPEEGYTIRFSGFPDLILWRESPSILSETSFKLVEVKSPSDKLSEKQIAVLDTLCRCGFDVSVAYVTDIGQGVKNKIIQSKKK